VRPPYATTPQGENALKSNTPLIALAVATAAALSLPARAAVSEPTLILANGNESLLWHSVLPGTSVARWDKPRTATSATLTIVGAYYRQTYANLTGESCEISLPPAYGGKEDVYTLTLSFDDGTVRTAYLGAVDGLATGGTATSRRMRTASSPQWANFNDYAAIAIPAGATALTVNGTPLPDLDGSAGWRLVKYDGTPQYDLAMTVAGSASPLLATLNGFAGGTILYMR
jgi:hypothetical protein